MRQYKEVPEWWYGVLTVVVLGLGILTTRYWDTELPVWGFIVVCFGLAVLLIVPEGIVHPMFDCIVAVALHHQISDRLSRPGVSGDHLGNDIEEHALISRGSTWYGPFILGTRILLIISENSSARFVFWPDLCECPSDSHTNRRYDALAPLHVKRSLFVGSQRSEMCPSIHRKTILVSSKSSCTMA
jgi:hypothetical protein